MLMGIELLLGIAAWRVGVRQIYEGDQISAVEHWRKERKQRGSQGQNDVSSWPVHATLGKRLHQQPSLTVVCIIH